MTLRCRISQPEIPTMSARRSSTPSIANCAWLAPKPRNAPQIGLLVRTASDSTSMAGTWYGPLAWPAARSSARVTDHAAPQCGQLAGRVAAAPVLERDGVPFGVDQQALLTRERAF